MFPLGLLVVVADGRLLERGENQRSVVALWEQRREGAPDPLYYTPKRSFAGEFYSAGHARTADDATELPRQGSFYVAVKDSRRTAWAWPDGVRCDDVGRTSKTVLYRCSRPEHSGLEELALRHAAIPSSAARN